MGKQLKSVKSVKEIPEHMTGDQAADFYASHSLAEVWDQLEPVDESLETVEPTPKPAKGRKQASA